MAAELNYRKQIAEWVGAQVVTGAKTSTVRNSYFLVRMVLAQAVVDGRLTASPADHGKVPSATSPQSALGTLSAASGEASATASVGTAGVIDDSAQFLTDEQVAALSNATPWPCNVLVHVAKWSGLRAAELAGLQVGDVNLPGRSLSPNATGKPGSLRVERTVQILGGKRTC